MPESTSRRDVLKTMAAVGAAVVAQPSLAQSISPVRDSPATRPAPLVGIQIGALPLARREPDELLSELRDQYGINALFVFAYGHVARWVPMAQEGFRGGNFAIPHMQYYQGANLSYEDMRAPEFGNVDILARIMPASKRHGFKTYALVQEADKEAPVAAWNAYYQMDSHGRRQGSHPGGPCHNNPAYRAFTLGLMEDYLRSYGVDGFMWSSERQGGVLNTLGLWHHGGNSDPTKGTCFCDYCIAKGKAQGIDTERVRQGFAVLEQFTRDGRARRKPRDGYFVAFMRLLLKNPELLLWEAFWINSRKEMMLALRDRVKSVDPKTPVGFHVWHNASFSPFYRAEIDFAEMAQNADFIKPVLYNTSAGERMTSFVDSIGNTIFGDLPRSEILHMLYEMFDYRQAPYDEVGKAGFTTDYITREVKRTLDDAAGTGTKVYAGLDIDIPDAGATYTQESVKLSVMAALNAGAHGVIFARNYGEMNHDHLKGVGDALKELGMR